MNGTLYIVATPIGNLKDITYRAVETLQSVEIIACEDTRHSQKLLNHFGIKKKLISYHSHNENNSTGGIVALLKNGNDVAYISDAGTPGISDPGTVLVSECWDQEIPVVPIPGPAALTTLLCASGIPAKSVLFEGFLSPKPGKRKKRLDELLSRGDAFVLYESPHRIVKTLEVLAELSPTRQIVVGRELTKMHEELLRGSSEMLFDILKERNVIKGEVSLLVSGEKKR